MGVFVSQPPSRLADDLAAQHRRNRRNRSVRFWNGEDGSVQMRGSFDAEMGARIQQRLRRQAEQIRQADRDRRHTVVGRPRGLSAAEHEQPDRLSRVDLPVLGGPGTGTGDGVRWPK